jgi:hypothetical protein
MSIMFPTIFSLGIHGLGSRAKKASSFIVMAIIGGAIMPKLMGYIADKDAVVNQRFRRRILPICQPTSFRVKQPYQSKSRYQRDYYNLSVTL